MSGKTVASLIAGLVIGIAVGALGWHPEAKATPNRAEGWEYKTVLLRRTDAEFAGGAENKLNALAKDGWEYIGPVYSDLPVIAFKRLRK
ncbi:MAG: hypothetical protein E6K70_24075 [Planctomycetota bacterium]|nr:MAG: hypothetical protein E6K70_24075 [Planctomycetota bacterium]